MANKAVLRDTMTYLEEDGAKATWIEDQTSPAKPWGLGCSVCRIAWEQRPSRRKKGGVGPLARNKAATTRKKAATRATIWARTEARTKEQTKFTNMRRHSRSKTHLQALRELRRSCCSSGDDGVANDRNDVPCLEAFYAAYKGARLGHSFLDYEAEHHPREATRAEEGKGEVKQKTV